MSSIKLKHSGGNSMIIAAPSSNPAADRTISLNDTYAGNGSFVTANSSGNVGIGESSPATILHLKANFGDMLRLDRDNAGAVGNQLAFRYKDGSGNFVETGTLNCVSTSNADSGKLSFSTKVSGGSNTERMSISSDGTTQMTGDAGSGDAQHFKFFASGDVVHLKTAGTSAANHGMIQFRDGNNAYCGQITSHGTNHTTSYVTNSDYRLKQNEASISDGITRLKQLKPYRFEWKSSGDKVDGFFAHAAQAVVPESVIGTKDEVETTYYSEGETIPEGKAVGDVTVAAALISVKKVKP